MTEIIAKRPKINKKLLILRNQLAILLIVLGGVIGAMGGITKGATLGRTNIVNVLVQSATRGVASMGQAFVILSGGIDLSVSGVATMSSMIGGSLMASGQDAGILGYGMSTYPAVLIVLLTGLGLGSLSGLAVSRVHLPSLIVTLGIWQVANGVGYQICEGKSITDLPLVFAYLGQGSALGVPVPIIIFIAVSAVCYMVLNYTSFGRSVYAVGGNPVSSWLSGINVERTMFAVYAISGFLAAISGAIASARLNVASIRTMVGLELDSIAAVSIGGVNIAGGRGSLLGVILGVLIIGVVNNGLSVMGAGPAIVDITKGVIIFASVAAYVVITARR